MEMEQTENKTHKNKKVLSTEEIFQGSQEVLIEHEGEYYQLRITRNKKLILTK